MTTQIEVVFDAESIAQQAVRACLHNKKRVLIVGTKKDNLPAWMDNDARIVQWDSEGHEIKRAQRLPENVGLVFFFKWLGHRHHKRISAIAKGEGVYAHPELLNTGEVRRALTLFAPLPEEQQPTTLETPPPTPPAQKWGGTLFGFVEEHYEYGSDHGHQKAEAERILRLAYAQGLTSSLASVTSTISSVHRTISRAREDARLATVPPVPDVIDLLVKPLDPAKAGPLTEVEAGKVMAMRGPLPTSDRRAAPAPPTLTVSTSAQAELEKVAAALPTAPAPKATVASLVAAGATNAAAVDTSVAELLRMLDDAVAVLGLAREQLVALSAQNTAMRTSHAALRARLLGVIDDGI
jgi:hypothetical protein